MRITNIIVNKTFKKSFTRLDKKVQGEFSYRIGLFLDDQFHPLLNNHPLHGKWQDYWSINITSDIRAIYKAYSLTAVFVEIGSHNKLYR